jgi:hypothetical protein
LRLAGTRETMEMHSSSAIWIVVYAGILLAWPTASFIWQRVVRRKSVKSALAIALFVSLLSMVLGMIITGAIAVKPHSWLFRNVGWVLPLVWIAIPLSAIAVAIVIASRRQDQ